MKTLLSVLCKHCMSCAQSKCRGVRNRIIPKKLKRTKKATNGSCVHCVNNMDVGRVQTQKQHTTKIDARRNKILNARTKTFALYNIPFSSLYINTPIYCNK